RCGGHLALRAVCDPQRGRQSLKQLCGQVQLYLRRDDYPRLNSELNYPVDETRVNSNRKAAARPHTGRYIAVYSAGRRASRDSNRA
ncbi:MAG: hypothetical protein Q4D04_06915, partial [Clostridia bacterium]|nr:hypothetical protein [Clostridia bacterium]